MGMGESLEHWLEMTKSNLTISDAFTKADSVINNPKYKTIICSVSGGSDSDIMMDMLTKVDRDNKIKYIYIDTGLEYEATKKHIRWMRFDYYKEIAVLKADKPIPLCVYQNGQPFLSKNVSNNIERLQRHGFKFEDEPFDVLIEKYPNCVSAIEWWCNRRPCNINNIKYNKYLKEFMVENPPQFKISDKCCHYAKKLPAKRLSRYEGADLVITGIRRAEKGIRSLAYKNCYTVKNNDVDTYRPLFWFSDDDKCEYKQIFDLKYSECYEKWGMTRTGCVCCPFALDLNFNLKVTEQNEPKMYKAVTNIFKDTYEYTRAYKEYVKAKKYKPEIIEVKPEVIKVEENQEYKEPDLSAWFSQGG